jgi:hypothetical protein
MHSLLHAHAAAVWCSMRVHAALCMHGSMSTAAAHSRTQPAQFLPRSPSPGHHKNPSNNASPSTGALVRHVKRRRSGAGSSTADSEEESDFSLPARLTPAASGDVANARPKTPNYDATTVPPVTLEWSDLGYTLTTKTGDKKVILKGAAGSAVPGRLLAIM